MRHLATIVRLLLTLALLGGGPALAECCCGTGQAVCPMEMESSLDYQAWSGVWQKASQAVTPDDKPSTQGVASSCTLEQAPSDCPCWKPLPVEQRASIALAPQGVSGVVVSAPTRVPVAPKSRTLPKVIEQLPPERPPIDQFGWSYALFPLPPPSLV